MSKAIDFLKERCKGFFDNWLYGIITDWRNWPVIGSVVLSSLYSFLQHLPLLVAAALIIVCSLVVGLIVRIITNKKPGPVAESEASRENPPLVKARDGKGLNVEGNDTTGLRGSLVDTERVEDTNVKSNKTSFGDDPIEIQPAAAAREALENLWREGKQLLDSFGSAVPSQQRVEDWWNKCLRVVQSKALAKDVSLKDISRFKEPVLDETNILQIMAEVGDRKEQWPFSDDRVQVFRQLYFGVKKLARLTTKLDGLSLYE